jgi:MATE family multidrug resistance protein
MHLASLAAMGLYSARALPEHALFARLWRPDWEAMGRVYRLGWPIGLTNLAETGLFAMSAVMIGWIGTRELAAHGIAMQLASLFFMVHIGLSQAATVRAGSAMGRRDAVGLRRGGLAAIAMSVAFSAVTISAFLGIPETLSGFFLGADDPERGAIIAIGVQLLAVAALFQLADGAQVMALGLLRGVQDTRVPFLYAVVAYWGIGVPTSYVLGFWAGLGAVGVWLGLVVGLALAAAALMGRFWLRSIHRALAAA